MFKGENIRRIAEQKGLKLKEVYEGAGIKEQTFFSIVSGRGNPQSDKLEAIADFLECLIDDFFDREHFKNGQLCKVSGNGNKVQQGTNNVMTENVTKEIEYLQVLLREKEALLEAKNELLKEKDRTIGLLMKSKE